VAAGLVVVDEDAYHVRHALIAEVAYRALLPGDTSGGATRSPRRARRAPRPRR
jgi:hypothetical protein